MTHSTSTEDDSELLKDLVVSSLDKEGVLGKIKAQLRAHVYLSLESEQNKTKKTGHVNSKLADFLLSTNGRLVASLVREFLQFFDLDFSLAVFDPETNIGRDVQYRERTKLSSALGLTELTDPEAPLLSEIMRLSKVSVLKSESPTPSSISDSMHTSGAASLADDPPSHHSSNHSSQNSTPEISLQDQHSLEAALLGTTFNKTSSALSPKDPSTIPSPSVKENSKEQSSNLQKEASLPPFSKDLKSAAPKPSFLSDLPPLGRSSLGDLPPLTGLPPARGLNLAPLKQPKPSGDVEKELLANVTIADPMKKKSLANFGFQQDHVLNEKRETSDKENKTDDGSGTNTPDLTDNIEEELDSFLNSEISEANDVTKDETLANSDVSLKVDYVDSLK